MASWKEERDRLVAQTLAFVQQVAAAHPRPNETRPVEQLSPAQIVSVLSADIVQPSAPPIDNAPSASEMGTRGTAIVTEPQVLTAAMLPNHALYSPVSERADITKRVATFKARQSQIGREREAYYEAMQARIRTSLSPDSGNVSGSDRL
jgi:hypothetical protein